MRVTIVLSLMGFLILLACQSLVNSSVKPSNLETTAVQKDGPQIAEIEEEDEVWSPTAIEGCMTKVDVDEPFKFETSFNPFYLRADLDGNELIDYAILIKGQNTNKRGLVICKDSKEPFVFGELSKSKVRLSSFENDNFITPQWEISTAEFTKKQVNATGRKIAPDAKGESISFVFEGGGVNIYWDGKQFRIGE